MYCLFPLLLLWKLLALLTMMMTRKEKSTKEWRDGTTNFKEHRAHNSCWGRGIPTTERLCPSNLLKLSNATNAAIAAASKDDDVEYKGDHSSTLQCSQRVIKTRICPLNIQNMKNHALLASFGFLLFFFFLFSLFFFFFEKTHFFTKLEKQNNVVLFGFQ